MTIRENTIISPDQFNTVSRKNGQFSDSAGYDRVLMIP